MIVGNGLASGPSHNDAIGPIAHSAFKKRPPAFDYLQLRSRRANRTVVLRAMNAISWFFFLHDYLGHLALSCKIEERQARSFSNSSSHILCQTNARHERGTMAAPEQTIFRRPREGSGTQFRNPSERSTSRNPATQGQNDTQPDLSAGIVRVPTVFLEPIRP
jgi:hypothetical protein